MKPRTALATFVLVPALAAGAYLFTAAGPGAAEDPIEARQQAMKDNGKAAKQLGAIFKGEAEFDGDVVRRNAEIIAAKIADAKKLFPEGSTSDDSRAKPEIWEKWDEFAAAADEAITAAEAVAAVGANDDADGFKPAFASLGKSCGGCHKPFRKPKD